MTVYDSGSARASYILDISQPRQAAAELRALFQGIQQQSAALSKVGGSSGATQAADQQKAERAILARAAAEARLAQVQNTGKNALAGLSQAEQIYQQALAKVDQTSIAAIRTQSQLAAVQNRIANQAGGGLPVLPRTVEAFGTQAIDQFKAGLLGIVGPAALATGAITALKGAADLAVEGENINRVSRSFESLAKQAGTSGDAIIRALRAASGGEISDLNIQLAADKGLLLGVANTAEQFASIMEIARDRAAKMGITTTQAFDDITTGIGRESPRILDNLGIIVDADAANEAYARSIGKTTDELTKAERIEALRNAVIAQGKSTLDAQTTAINDQTNSYARLGVAVENAKNRTASFLSTQTQGAAGGVADLINGILNPSNDTASKAAAGAQSLVRALGGLPPVTNSAQAAQIGWTKSVFDWIQAREIQIGLLNTPTNANGGGGAFNIAQVQDSTAAQLRYADSLEMTGVQARAAALAADQKSAADKVASLDAQTHGIAEEKLAKQAQFAAEALLRAGPAGARSAAILAGSSQQIDVLTAAFYRLAAAKQAAIVTNPLAGITEDRSERQGTAGNNEARIAIAEKAAAAEQARLRQTIQTGTATQKTAALQRQYNDAVRQFGKNSKEAIDAQTSLIAAQQAADKAAGRGRVSAAQSTALQLNNVEENNQLQLLRTQREGLERLRDQQEDFDVRKARSQEDEERKIRGLLARGQRAAAAREREDFAREQARAREDFDRERRRTLRNNQEGLGDIGDRTDLRTQQIGARAALRGVTTAGANVPPASLSGTAAASAAASAAPRVLTVQIAPTAVQIDGHQIVTLTWPETRVLVDDELSAALLGVGTPGSGQTAVAGAG